MVDVMGITGVEGDCKAVEKASISHYMSIQAMCVHTHTLSGVCVSCAYFA